MGSSAYPAAQYVIQYHTIKTLQAQYIITKLKIIEYSRIKSTRLQYSIEYSIV